ncbi:hypothetical protein [Paenibacillus sambharensis]|uniref:hypothetical protein n=1 Tax=Paenibacillus sambharensis TaxID=1803190 RepID=UPI0015E893FC|nr:hypothetical protein [Paenibacillus sambharensis]
MINVGDKRSKQLNYIGLTEQDLTFLSEQREDQAASSQELTSFVNMIETVANELENIQ